MLLHAKILWQTIHIQNLAPDWYQNNLFDVVPNYDISIIKTWLPLSQKDLQGGYSLIIPFGFHYFIHHILCLFNSNNNNNIGDSNNLIHAQWKSLTAPPPSSSSRVQNMAWLSFAFFRKKNIFKLLHKIFFFYICSQRSNGENRVGKNPSFGFDQTKG